MRKTEPSRLARMYWSVATSFGLLWAASRRRFLLAVGPQLLTGVATGIQFMVMRDLIAVALNGANSGGLERVAVLLGQMIGISLFMSVAALMQQQQQALLSAEVERHQNALLLDRISCVDLKRFETPEFQDLQRRAMNAMGRMMGVTAAAIGLARDVFLVVGVAAALYVFEPVLLIIVMIGFVPMWLASAAGGRQTYDFWRSQTPNERLRSYILGLFTGREYAKELRAFALAPYLRGIYERLSAERLTELATSLRRRMRFALVNSAASTLVTGLTYAVLAFLVIEHRLGLAEAGVGVVASQQLCGQLSGLLTDLTLIYESSLFLEDWQGFTVMVPPRPQQAPVSLGRFRKIDLDHVWFCYPAATTTHASAVPPRPALADVSMEIHAGEVVAVVGENGSGKTTLAKLLSGLYQPDAGRVRWDGVDTLARDPGWIHDRVAVLFQDFARFMLTARENIGLGRTERINDRAAIEDAALRAGASDFIETWAERYETILGPFFAGGSDVSIGQWQRIALARAFFRDAPLVVLDEPTSALDARAEHDLFTRMRDLFDGRAVLLISHRFSSVRCADRIYVLHEGRIVEHGTHEELVRAAGRYAELYALQASAYAAVPYRVDDLPTEPATHGSSGR